MRWAETTSVRTSEVFCHENEKKEKVVIRDQNLSFRSISNTERENVVVRTVATVLFEPGYRTLPSEYVHTYYVLDSVVLYTV